MVLRLKLAVFVFSILVVSSCSSQQKDNTYKEISTKEFSVKLSERENATLLDVRTPFEYENGHIENAILADFNSSDFENRIKDLDKKKPVFVYCLSGGRSRAAAQVLIDKGFSDVFELEGGIMRWKNEGLPLSFGKNVEKPKSNSEQILKAINDNELVLIDFYAEWCVPCKKMKPMLQALENELGSTCKVVRIDADKETEFAKKYSVEVLPTLLILNKKEEVWRHKGWIEKQDLENKIKEFSDK
jgi:thioredoxin 1